VELQNAFWKSSAQRDVLAALKTTAVGAERATSSAWLGPEEADRVRGQGFLNNLADP
jgi:hypothetical protein